MNLPLSYRDFLEAKVVMASEGGFAVALGDINPLLKPHQKAIVQWACQGGRRAIFAAFGLGKSFIQLEILRLVLHATGQPVLQVAPLGVRLELMGDARTLSTGDHPDITEAQRQELAAWLDGRPDRAIDLVFVRHSWEVKGPGHYLANYESVRDGKLDPALFAGASLDEASCLRGFGGTKTFREFMRLFDGMAFKFVATATPSPNEFIELLSYSAFLEVMDIGQAKTRFFKRNSEKADSLTIHPHKVREFWLWVASWGLFVERPSDLGFSDEGYDLPPLSIHWHELPSDHETAGIEKSGQWRLLKNAAGSLSDAAREKRDSLAVRVAKVMEIVRNGRSPEGLPARLLPQEQREAAGAAARARQAELSGEAGGLSGAVEALEGCQPGEGRSDGPCLSREEPGQDRRQKRGLVPCEQATRHRDCLEEEAPPDGDQPVGLSCDGGAAGALLCDLPSGGAPEGQDAALCGSRPSDWSGAGPAVPPVQRGHGALARQSIATVGSGGLPDQFIVWCNLNDEQRAVDHELETAGLSHVSLYGNQDVYIREELMHRWKRGERIGFVSKAQMYGAGVNLQQCSRMVFAGIGHKFQDLIQACHRIYRFGQKRSVDIHFIYTEAERPIRDAIEAKWRRHDEQRAIMTSIIREYGLSAVAMASSLKRGMGVERVEVAGKMFQLVNNDCVEECRSMPDSSVDLIITSIPFSTQYEYSPNYADFGHTDDDAHFWAQMDFLIPQLLRVLQPGRIAAIHVKDRIVPGGLTGLGFQTLSPFSDDCIARFKRHGWAFLARKTIVTDVVRENNQTYRLGWSEQCKDGSRMGAGLPEYLLIFRKPPSDSSNGYADRPVKKAKKEWGAGTWSDPNGYSRARWQLDAHGFQKSDGNRLLTPDELRGLDANVIYKVWKRYSLGAVYDFEHHVRLAEGLEEVGGLPSTFMLLPPHTDHPDVWSDVARMLTMNTLQAQQGREMHLCPLQFDIIDRAIAQYSEAGETVFDPFGGVMSVPYRALKAGRRGRAVELNPAYFRDGCAHVARMAEELETPDLFGVSAIESEQIEPEAMAQQERAI